MMKLTTLVLLVLCGVAVKQASAFTIKDCPDLLSSLPVKCGFDTGLSFPTPMDCSSPILECVVNAVLESLGLDPASTQFNSTVLIEVLGAAGISATTVDTCRLEVGKLITGEVDVNECQVALIGELLLCLFQNCLL